MAASTSSSQNDGFLAEVRVPKVRWAAHEQKRRSSARVRAT